MCFRGSVLVIGIDLVSGSCTSVLYVNISCTSRAKINVYGVSRDM